MTEWWQERLRDWFSFRTVAGKTMLITKTIVIVTALLFWAVQGLPETVGWLIFCLALVMLAILTDALFRRLITTPLKELNHTAKEMARLNLQERSHLNRQDELGQLAGSLNQMAANLEAALKQRKELSDTLSHQMKTPLGIIRAYAEGLRDESEAQKRREYAQVIIEEAEKMAGLVNDLLDLSALEAGAAPLNQERLDLVELVEICAGRHFLDSPQGDYHFHYQFPQTACIVKADRQRLTEVLDNFMTNAQKFVTTGGQIRLLLTIITDSRTGQPAAQFSLYNDTTLLSQVNTEDLWNAFYRNKAEKDKKGSGLGLAIVKHILKLHDFPYGAEKTTSGVCFFFSAPLQSES